MQEIPLIDIRDSSPVTLLETRANDAIAIIKASRNSFGSLGYAASFAALPIGDLLARRWLEKTANPYRSEIAHYADRLKVPGVWALNLAYEFACTTGIYATEAGPRLLRVLDWPFLGLGKHIIVAHQKGSGGDFHNITWPATSGVFTAMAKGRFCVALNQAPMRRHNTGLYIDWVRNRLWAWREKSLPPAHLLRKVCETAANYAEAKDMLMREPVAVPVIYSLSGINPGEGCIIERLEAGAALREMGNHPNVYTANHFLSHLNGIGLGWMARPIDSFSRAVSAGVITGRQAVDPQLRWFKPPIANFMSRLCFSGNANEGSFSLMGTEGETEVTALMQHPC